MAYRPVMVQGDKIWHEDLDIGHRNFRTQAHIIRHCGVCHKIAALRRARPLAK